MTIVLVNVSNNSQDHNSVTSCNHLCYSFVVLVLNFLRLCFYCSVYAMSLKREVYWYMIIKAKTLLWAMTINFGSLYHTCTHTCVIDIFDDKTYHSQCCNLYPLQQQWRLFTPNITYQAVIYHVFRKFSSINFYTIYKVFCTALFTVIANYCYYITIYILSILELMCFMLCQLVIFILQTFHQYQQHPAII